MDDPLAEVDNFFLDNSQKKKAKKRKVSEIYDPKNGDSKITKILSSGKGSDKERDALLRDFLTNSSPSAVDVEIRTLGEGVKQFLEFLSRELGAGDDRVVSQFELTNAWLGTVLRLHAAWLRLALNKDPELRAILQKTRDASLSTWTRLENRLHSCLANISLR